MSLPNFDEEVSEIGMAEPLFLSVNVKMTDYAARLIRNLLHFSAEYISATEKPKAQLYNVRILQTLRMLNKRKDHIVFSEEDN
jgi:hypothetical protein